MPLIVLINSTRALKINGDALVYGEPTSGSDLLEFLARHLQEYIDRYLL